MGPNDFAWMPATDQLAAMDAKEVSSTELVDLYLSRIDEHNAVLHRREYSVLTYPTGQLRRFRQRMNRLQFRGSAIDLNADMWNSGAIGLHPSQFHLLQTVLGFIDVVSPRFKKQLVEQYAVAYYLQKNATVHPCDDVLFHYWAQKAEYQRAIETRLGDWKGKPLESALDDLRRNPIVLPPYIPRHGWVRRLSDRIFGSDEAPAAG